jgi:endogenous inhibitor of DNA gyrase (YacG/DUF329 family)
MGQKRYSVNCPYCGNVVEVVCPLVKSEPSKVEAREPDRSRIFPTLPVAVETSQAVCPECRGQMVIWWWK